MPLFRKSINRKLMLLFFVVGVASLTVIGTYSYYNAKNALLKRTLDQLTSIRVIKKGQVEFFFRERIRNILVLSQNEQLKELVNNVINTRESNKNTFSINTLNQKVSYDILGFNDLFIVDVFNSEEVTFYQFQKELFFKVEPDSTTQIQLKKLSICSFEAGTPCIVDFAKKSNSDTIPYCYIGTQIDCSENKHKALLAMRIPISDINNIMLDNNPQNGLGHSGEVYLVGSDFYMRSNSRFFPNSVLSTKVYTTGAKNAFSIKQGSAIIDDYRTIAVLSSYERLDIPNLEWAILAEIDYSEAMIPIDSIRNDIIFLSFIICLFLFSISHFISKTITNPIIRLRDAAQKVGRGELNFSVNTNSNDEIGELSDAFNNMLTQLNEERRNHMTALFNGQEMERQRISRELHDGLGQKLVAIKLQLESTSKHSPAELSDTLREVKENFNKTIDEVRQISNNLAPNILNESTLDVAIGLLCNSMKRTTTMNIEFSSHGEFLFSNTTVKTYIYRIAQEAMNNAIKHSQASRLCVQLIESRENVILVIEDNGIGFAYQQNYCSPCNGIYNMKERARLTGGTLDIETENQQGTTIRLKIPKTYFS